MANLFSDLLTLRDTTGEITDGSTYIGDKIVTRGLFNFSSNPADDDAVLMLEIPSNARPHSIYSWNDDIGDASVTDWGIFASTEFTDTNVARTVYTSNSVILQTAFDSGNSSLNSTVQDTHLDNRFQAAGSSSQVTGVNNQMWQIAGLDSDPHLPLRIGITFTTNWAIFAGGNLYLVCKYS